MLATKNIKRNTHKKGGKTIADLQIAGFSAFEIQNSIDLGDSLFFEGTAAK
jgi:hypothetical protein